MSVIFDTKEAVFFIGGRGDKSGDKYAGGGCTKTFWGDINDPSKTLADVMDANGGVLSDILASLGDTACDVVTNGSGKVRITKVDGGYFTDCSAGLIVRAVFAATYTSGRYEVTAVDGVNGDWIDIDETYSADTTCSAQVGGAFPNLQDALDLADSDTYSVYILDNKDETITTKIDFDTHSGAADSHVFIIGMNADCTVEEEITIATTTELSNGILCFADGLDYSEWRNIDFDAGNKTDDGAYCVYNNFIGSHSHKFIECKFRGASSAGVYWKGLYFRFFGCDFYDNTGYGLNMPSWAAAYGIMSNCSLHDNVGGGALWGCKSCVIDFCKFYDNTTIGLDVSDGGDYAIIVNNTAYINDGDGFEIDDAAIDTVVFNNASVGNGGYGFDLQGKTIPPAFFGYNLAAGNTGNGSDTTHCTECLDTAFANFRHGNNIASVQAAAEIFTSVEDDSEDFTPKAGSDLIDAGFDGGYGEMDIGAVQSANGGGGGGLLTSLGMSGGFD